MFGNNINNPFMMNNMYTSGMMGNMMRSTPMMGNMMRSAPILGNTMMNAPRGSGLLSSLFGRGASGLGGISKSFNFGTLLTNTSKALGVVKDAIPIVKEVGPMVGNMRQMLKIASIFKDETDSSTIRSTKVTNSSTEEQSITSSKENDTNIISTTTNQNNNQPNFFL